MPSNPGLGHAVPQTAREQDWLLLVPPGAFHEWDSVALHRTQEHEVDDDRNGQSDGADEKPLRTGHAESLESGVVSPIYSLRERGATYLRKEY